MFFPKSKAITENSLGKSWLPTNILPNSSISKQNHPPSRNKSFGKTCLPLKVQVWSVTDIHCGREQSTIKCVELTAMMGVPGCHSWETAFLPHPRTFIPEQPRISTQRALLICCMVHDILPGLVSFGWQNKICQWCSETWQATGSFRMGKDDDTPPSDSSWCVFS